MSEQALVEMHGITKQFGAVTANAAVDFEVRSGEVHALLGENGAGKTTLMNMLSGLYRPDRGTIRVRGEAMSLDSPRAAIDHGIGMVHQHFRLVDRFNAAENLTLGWHAPRRIIRARRLIAAMEQLGRDHGLPVDCGRPIWQLSVGEQQRIEILKNLYRQTDVIILDEPTAVLSPQDATDLCANLRRIASDGRGIVFISHKLKEVMQVSDRVTVLRRGEKVATVATCDTSATELTELMMGGAGTTPPTAAPASLGETILDLRELRASDDRGHEALRGVTLAVRAGEVVGVAGVAGNGQKELAEAIVGLRQPAGGAIAFRSQDISRWSIRRRADAGIGYVPEDRLRQGVAKSLSLEDNLVLKEYRAGSMGRGPLLDRKRASRVAERLMEDFDVRGATLHANAGTLSGGNVQKLVLAREISRDPWVLVASQPTRGLDIGASHATRELLLRQRTSGRGVLLISEDLDEIMSLADTIAVMYEGRIVRTFASGTADEREIGSHMAGRTA